ncbi:hypothetical protein F5H01DRAFT_347588, partial [Linnemannia elongata]
MVEIAAVAVTVANGCPVCCFELPLVFTAATGGVVVASDAAGAVAGGVVFAAF